jgi:hypothetical protein
MQIRVRLLSRGKTGRGEVDAGPTRQTDRVLHQLTGAVQHDRHPTTGGIPGSAIVCVTGEVEKMSLIGITFGEVQLR